MVEVCLDPKRQYVGNIDIEINSFDDYVKGYADIISAIYGGGDVVAVIRNRQIYGLLSAQGTFYNHRIRFTEYSVKANFKQEKNVETPAYISDEELVSDDSIKDVDFSSGEGFENAVLRKEFGTFFLGDTFPFVSLGQLCRSVSLDSLKDKKRVVLRKVFQHRFKSYRDKLKGDYEKYIFNQFTENYEGLRSDVAIYLVIKDFPKDFKEDILGHDLCKCMDNIKVSGTLIPLDDSMADLYRDRFRMYLKDKNTAPEILLGWVSGAYTFELDSLIKEIEDRNLRVDDYAVRLQNKFSPLFEESPEQELRIKNLIPPVTLVAPGEDFDIDEWMKWSVDTYLPYHFWLEYNKRYDETADSYAGRFGDWIFEHYDDLVAGYPNMMYRVLPGVKDELLSNEHTLFVILDNFNYKFYDFLVSCMNKEKFSHNSTSPVLAMIPTETAISKRAFFTAEAYNDKKDSYSKITKNWADNLGIEMHYLPNVGELSKLDRFDKKVYFLNYLRLDEMLHEDQGSSAQRIEVRIQKELEALIETIGSVLRRLSAEKTTSVYFIADHGSTQILAIQPNQIAPKFFKEKALESDYRFIEVSDADYESTQAAIGGLCYALDKSRYGTESNFFIAKGYNRFIKNDLSGYVHGGITPEEAIVPFAKFSYDMETCKDPEIQLLSDNLRFSVTLKLTFAVKNYNEFPLDNFEFMIQNSNIKYSKPDVLTIDGMSTGTLEFAGVRISKALDKKNNETLFGTVTYTANGRKHSYTVELKMDVKSAMGSSSDLSDLFI